MQHAGADVGNMNLIAGELQAVHEFHRRARPPLMSMDITPEVPIGRYFCARS